MYFQKTAHSSKQSMYYTVELVTNHYPQGIVEWPLETGWPLYTGSLESGFFLYKLYRDMYHFIMQSVKKNVTQSTVASWGPWASSVAGTWGTLEDIVHKLINLSAPHCNIKVLGAIWDAWPPTDPYNIQLMRSYFCKIWFVTHSSQ